MNVEVDFIMKIINKLNVNNGVRRQFFVLENAIVNNFFASRKLYLKIPKYITNSN